MANLHFELPALFVTENNKDNRLEEELGPAVLDAGLSLWREYSALSETAPAAFAICDRELLSWYAELQYKTRGGGRCSQCQTPVRHALKLRSVRQDGSTSTHVCLCTRCLVAEEALAERVMYRVAGQWIETRSSDRRRADRARLEHSRQRGQAA